MSKNQVEKQLAFEDLDKQLSELTDKLQYYELYGYDLRELAASQTGLKIRQNLLTKFLVANKHDVGLAKEQLKKTLEWRKKFDPLSAAFKEKHNTELDNMGVITQANGITATWNLYGAVKNREELFSNLDEFVRWRVGLMERGISLLDFASDDELKDSYMVQTHDYFDVSFFRLDAATKAASSKTIQLFQDYYPEFVSKKYFVNVPLIMAWMFSFVKAFMSAETAAKLTMISNGKDLAQTLGSWVPAKYGGKGDLVDIEVKQFKEPEAWKARDKEEQQADPFVEPGVKAPVEVDESLNAKKSIAKTGESSVEVGEFSTEVEEPVSKVEEPVSKVDTKVEELAAKIEDPIEKPEIEAQSKTAI